MDTKATRRFNRGDSSQKLNPQWREALRQRTYEACLYRLGPIPEELKQPAHWVCWKPTKIPINPRTGNNAQTNNSETWGTYLEALEFWLRHKRDGIQGVGFVLTKGWVGVDLDHCRNPETEEIKTWAEDIIIKLDSYSEISPSGTGVHILLKGTLPDYGRRKGSIRMYDEGSIEMYDEGRYFTVTGDHIEWTPLEVLNRDEVLRKIHVALLEDKHKSEKSKTQSKDENWVEKLKSGVIQRGERDDTATRAAGYYVNKGYERDEIVRILSTFDWEGEDFELKDIEKCVDSIFRKDTRNHPEEPVIKLDWDSLKTCNDEIVAINEQDEWVVKGLIVKKEINIWYGPAGIAKSHMVWFLGNGIADGRRILSLDMWKHPCLYIDLENSETIRAHYQEILGKGSMKILSLQDHIVIPDIDSGKFEEFITAIPPCVVFIDTAIMLIGQKKFAEGKWEVTPVMKVLKSLCAGGYTFVLIFHSLKGDPKTIKGPQELIAQADHLVAFYEVKEAGTDEEFELEEDPNRPKTLFVGTRQDMKSRHEKSKFFMYFNPNQDAIDTGFSRLDSPNIPTYVRMSEELSGLIQKLETELGRPLRKIECPSKEKFAEAVNENLGIGIIRAKDLIKKGEGKYWKCERERRGYTHYYLF